MGSQCSRSFGVPYLPFLIRRRLFIASIGIANISPCVISTGAAISPFNIINSTDLGIRIPFASWPTTSHVELRNIFYRFNWFAFGFLLRVIESRSFTCFLFRYRYRKCYCSSLFGWLVDFDLILNANLGTRSLACRVTRVQFLAGSEFFDSVP